VNNFVLRCITLVRFSDEGPLRTETCRDVKCGIVMQISKEQVCAFCWLNVRNLLSIMHGLNNIKMVSAKTSMPFLGPNKTPIHSKMEGLFPAAK
jgi:hypothetical protein